METIPLGRQIPLEKRCGVGRRHEEMRKCLEVGAQGGITGLGTDWGEEGRWWWLELAPSATSCESLCTSLPSSMISAIRWAGCCQRGWEYLHHGKMDDITKQGFSPREPVIRFCY